VHSRNVTDDEFPAFPSKKTVLPLCVPMIPVMKPVLRGSPFGFYGITFVFEPSSNPGSDFWIINGVALIKKELYPKFFILKIFNLFF
jgi:hypothetical protein